MSTLGDRIRLRRQIAAVAGGGEPARRTFLATIGDVAGNVHVTGQPNYIYITQIGRSTVRKALNVKVRPEAGLSVVCGYTAENPTVLQVLEVDWGGNPAPGDLSYLPAHHESHELGGGDEVWLAKEQITALAPYPTNPVSNQIHVQADFYAYGSTLNYWPGGLTIDFITFLPTYLPTAHYGVYITVSIDGATNLLQYTAGTEFPSWPPPPIGTAILAPPLGSVPIAAVYLVAGNNLLPNDPGLLTDSFEVPGAGGPDIWANWTEFVGAGVLANDAAVFYAAGGGLNSCQTTEGGGGSDTGVYQDFVVTPGANYQLRFWTRDDGGANDGQYRIYDVTNAADIVAITGTGVVGGPAWVEVTQVFTAPAGCVSARVYFYCPGAGAAVAWFDDTTVASVPSSLNWNEIRDIRQISSPMGGSVAPWPHDVLSVSHSGTTPAVVVRGDLMTGQGVAPLWARLAHPGAANRVLQSTALEIGWSAGSLVLGGFTLTVPATGTAVIGGGAGAANRVAYWTDANTLASDAGLTYNAATDSLTIAGDILPVAASGQELGAAAQRWDLHTQEVKFGGGEGTNFITMPVNLNAGLVFTDGVHNLLEFKTLAQKVITFNQDGADIDFIVEATGVADAIVVQGSDGQITLGALGAGHLSASAAGVIASSANIVMADAAWIGNSVATARLHFDSSGATDYAYFLGCNVGIGDPTPEAKLKVGSVILGQYGMVMETDGAGRGFQVTTPDYVFNVAGSRLRMSMGAGAGDTHVIMQSEWKGTTPRVLALNPGGGRVSVGIAAPAASAILELSSTVGAVLLPRMTTAQRNALGAVNGMVIYNTTTATVEAYEAGAWVNL